MWQGKHQMIIGDWQYILLLALCPLSGGALLTLGAMVISASVIQGNLSIAVHLMQGCGSSVSGDRP